MKSKKPTAKQCFEYLDKHAGRLAYSPGSVLWPNGAVTTGSWQYAAGKLCVLAAVTSIEAVQQHMKVNKYDRR